LQSSATLRGGRLRAEPLDLERDRVRAWSEYGFADWAQAAPLIHGVKRARNVVADQAFRRLPARHYDRFMAELAGRQPQALAIAIAYNTPWVVDLTTRITARNLVGTLAVCDNSSDGQARRAIERLCRDRGIPYLPLPLNLERHPCRSHGIALNWVYYNVIDRIRPRVFGFLDHDLFAIDRLDLATLVADQPVYGLINESVWGWNLWAGFCVFDRAAVAGFDPDFNNDNPRLLDTGGRNWLRIYRNLDRTHLRFAGKTLQRLRLPGDATIATVQRIDHCLHVGGASFEVGSAQEARIEGFYRAVIGHLEAGGTLAALNADAREPALS
jgi:hypothetical protein